MWWFSGRLETVPSLSCLSNMLLLLLLSRFSHVRLYAIPLMDSGPETITIQHDVYTLILRAALLIRHAAAAKSLQPCPTLGDPIDSSPPGSPVPGILQARTLEWVAISFSNAGK